VSRPTNQMSRKSPRCHSVLEGAQKHLWRASLFCKHTAPAMTAPFLRQESPDPGISGFYVASVPIGLRSFRHADHASGRRTSGTTARGFEPPPTLSSRAPTSFATEESPASPSSAWRSAPAPAVPPCPHRAPVGVAAACARRRRHAASRRTRAHTRDASEREAAQGAPDRGPPSHRLAGRPLRARRRCQVGWGGADAAAATAVGEAVTGRPHARTRAASTGRTRRRGRGPPAARGTVGSAPTPPRRHAVQRGGEFSGSAAVHAKNVQRPVLWSWSPFYVHSVSFSSTPAACTGLRKKLKGAHGMDGGQCLLILSSTLSKSQGNWPSPHRRCFA